MKTSDRRRHITLVGNERHNLARICTNQECEHILLTEGKDYEVLGMADPPYSRKGCPYATVAKCRKCGKIYWWHSMELPIWEVEE